MSRFRDPVYLASDQYRDAGNLNARIQLHEHYSTNPYSWFRWMFDQLALPNEAKILEIGCGSGKLWLENLYRLPSWWKITLTDFSRGMVLGCFNQLATRMDQFRFTISDAMAIPFPPSTFDAVIANHMLYHVSDRPQALSEIARVMKPNGTLFAATNGENHMRELDELIEQCFSFDGGIVQQKPSRDFCLENGAVQLAHWFSRVEWRDYQDSLVVTDANAVLAYLYSMVPATFDQRDRPALLRLEDVIKEQIEQQGCIRIQKSSGIFIGKR